MSARFEIRSKKSLLNKEKFWVATIGNNNKVLQFSEKFPDKDSCHTNIRAMRQIVGMIGVVDTTKKAKDA